MNGILGLSGNPDGSDRIHCTRCGYEGLACEYRAGSTGLEVLLWCLALLPGLIYSLWRRSASFTGCADCRARETVPLSSWRRRHPAASA